MCGIAGIYSYHYAANPIDMAELWRMREHMAARGPDGAGEWCSDDHRVGLAHRRLSIIDLSDDGAQPMVGASGNTVITYNGEIYNYKTLRRELEQQGYGFRTDSDTEVLLQLYAAKGPRMVDELRGMFAFALWDGDKRRLLLARDPYGIKPLYYADDGWTLRFASQVKALIAGGGVSRLPEPAGWTGFLLLGSVPEPYTIYQEIRALPAGATMCVDSRGTARPVAYFNVSAEIRAAEERRPARQGELRESARKALLDSVRHHLVADVPVGIFLSAGVDSGALLGLMRDISPAEIHSVTLAYEDFRGQREDEAPGAQATAACYRSTHTTRTVTESEFRADLPRIFDAMDQPTVDGINTWFVSKAARELGLKAVVSGLGGDELFAGYSTFRDVPRWVHWAGLPSHIPFLGDMARPLIARSRRLHPKTAGLMKYGGTYAGAYLLRRGIFMPWELGKVMDSDFMAEGMRRLEPLRLIAASVRPAPRTPIGKVASFEACLYLRNQLLRDTDWASMAHSLETRVPFADRKLLTEIAPLVMSLPPGGGKQLLAATPGKALPSAVASRRKTGFETPIKDWLQRDDRTQTWRRMPELAAAGCPWARRWAYQLATFA